MTLKEQITKIAIDMPLINSPNKKEILDYENGLSNLEQVADDFAIGFGQWLVSNCYSEDDMYWWLIKTNGDVRKSTKELLEIYKKEKGL